VNQLLGVRQRCDWGATAAPFALSELRPDARTAAGELRRWPCVEM